MSTAFSPTAAHSLGGPDWLVARRTAAAEAFAATERPDAAAEEWRYSLIGQFDLERYAPAREFGDAPMPCLLYTSPSPRDAHESRMPSSA